MLHPENSYRAILMSETVCWLNKNINLECNHTQDFYGLTYPTRPSSLQYFNWVVHPRPPRTRKKLQAERNPSHGPMSVAKGWIKHWSDPLHPITQTPTLHRTFTFPKFIAPHLFAVRIISLVERCEAIFDSIDMICHCAGPILNLSSFQN